MEEAVWKYVKEGVRADGLVEVSKRNEVRGIWMEGGGKHEGSCRCNENPTELSLEMTFVSL